MGLDQGNTRPDRTHVWTVIAVHDDGDFSRRAVTVAGEIVVAEENGNRMRWGFAGDAAVRSRSISSWELRHLMLAQPAHSA